MIDVISPAIEPAATAPATPSHALWRILAARTRPMPALRSALVLVLLLLGFARLVDATHFLALPDAYGKDFLQEWLLGRAARLGVYPYQPISELAHRLIGDLPVMVFPHPTPHPPAVALISLPLSLLDYGPAVVAWFVVELCLILIAAALFLRWLGRPATPWLVAGLGLVALNWGPLWEGLRFGQLMTLLLVLYLGAWLALRPGAAGQTRERAALGGVLLGVAIACKLFAWPIVLYLALRRNWRAVLAAGGTFMVANGLAAAVIGPAAVVNYYRLTSAAVLPFYRAHFANISAASLGWRLFAGTGSTLLAGISAPPLVNVPALPVPLSLILPAALLAVALWLARRAPSFDHAFAILVCASVLVSPIAWTHYLTLALIPLAVLVRSLLAQRLPGRRTNAALIAGLMIFLDGPIMYRIESLFATGQTAVAGQDLQVSFLAALITLLPFAGMLGLIWLLATDKATGPEAVGPATAGSGARQTHKR